MPVPAPTSAEALAAFKAAVENMRDPSLPERADGDCVEYVRDEIIPPLRAITEFVHAVLDQLNMRLSSQRIEVASFLGGIKDEIGDLSAELTDIADALRDEDAEYERDARGWEKARQAGVD